MADFRDKLYDQYYNSQSGRRLNKDLKEKIRENHLQLRREILPLVPKSKDIKILDIGCGYGEWLMLLRQNGYEQTTGIDISPEQVEKAHLLGLQDVFVADVFDFLSQNPKTFNCITGIDIIEHFSKDELVRLLELIKGALTENGFAIFRTPNMDGILASVYAYGDFTHSSLLNYSSAMQIGIAAGFTKVDVLPSYIRVNGIIKEILRKFFWWYFRLYARLAIFASGRSTQGILLTPNLLLVVKR